MSGAEWIYRYILKTKWFNIAVLKKQFHFLGNEKIVIEYKKNGEWHTRYI